MIIPAKFYIKSSILTKFSYNLSTRSLYYNLQSIEFLYKIQTIIIYTYFITYRRTRESVSHRVLPSDSFALHCRWLSVLQHSNDLSTINKYYSSLMYFNIQLQALTYTNSNLVTMLQVKYNRFSHIYRQIRAQCAFCLGIDRFGCCFDVISEIRIYFINFLDVSMKGL